MATSQLSADPALGAHRAAADVVERVPKRLFVAGGWVAAEDGGTFDVVDPSTGDALCAVADATPVDGFAALEAAVAAQAAYAASAPRERADLLMRAFDLIHERIDDLALLMTLEMGKPLAEARGEIAYAAEFLRHFAGEAVRIDGGYQVAPTGGARFLVARQPVGPCLLITPWNFPLAMGTRKIGPAPPDHPRHSTCQWRSGARAGVGVGARGGRVRGAVGAMRRR